MQSAHVQSVLRLEGPARMSRFELEEDAFGMHEAVLSLMIVVACVANVGVVAYACVQRWRRATGRAGKDKEAYTGSEFSDDTRDSDDETASEADDVLDYDSGINW